MTKKSDTAFFDAQKEKAEADAALDKRKQEAEWWDFTGKKAEAQPSFEGRFVDTTIIQKDGDSGPYTAYLTYAEDMEGNLFRFWMSHKTLKESILAAAPAEGALLLMQFEGKVELSNGNSMFKYTVVADKQDRELWDGYRKVFESRAVAGAKTQYTESRTINADEAPF